jgi:glycosyltransferase involved in cell wall biosynthesis
VPFVLQRLHQLVDFAQGYFGRGDPYLAHPLCYREYAAQLARTLASESADVVHVATFFQYGPLLRRALPHARLVLHVHNHELAQFEVGRTARRLEAFDAIVTVSDFVTQALRRRFPGYRGTITTIFNGVDTDRFQPRQPLADCGVKRLLFVSRVSPDKGVHVLAQALDHILRNRDDVELDIVGKPGFLGHKIMQLHCSEPVVASVQEFTGRGLLQNLTREVLGHKESYINSIRSQVSPDANARIRWRGTVSLAELVQLYANATLFVLPSLWHEGFGIPVVEAMASGVPVVASRSGAVPELVVDGVTGRLVERGDVEGLASAIDELLDDEERRRRMGAAGRARVESTFTWAHSAGRLEQVLMQLTGVRGR